MDSKEIKNLRTDNNESVLTLAELFSEFKDKNIHFNFDISEPEVGIRIVEIARKFNLVDKIELAKTG